MSRKIVKAIWAIVAIVVLGIAFVVFPQMRHVHNCQRVEADVRALALKRPADVTRDQWQYMVGWTINDVGNCLASPRYADSGKLAQFANELHLRCAGKIDVSTIDWIWDQIAEMSPNYGKPYSDKYRPTTPERLEQAPYEHFSGIEVN
jgi:hypothetical protein